MPAATSKTDLRDVTTTEFAKLVKLIEQISPEQAALIHQETTIKDVIGHRAHWIDLFLGWYHDGQAGKPVFFPAKGYNWADLVRYNGDLRAHQSDLTWDDVKTMLQDNSDKLLGFIDRHSDADLYDAPMQGANNKWTPGRWAEAAGASHFRSAAKYIRAALRAAA